LPDSDFVNNYESPIKWCTIDILLRDCWVLKRLISKYYFKQKSTRSIKFKTVKDYFGTVETSVYYGEYTDSEDDDDDSEDSKAPVNNLSTFEEEYSRMIEREKQMGYKSNEESVDESKSKNSFKSDQLSVNCFNF
jgi:hypothetical protein